MKKSELKEYIREAILAELTPQDMAANTAAKKAIDDTVKDLALKVTQTTDPENKAAALAASNAAKIRQAKINKAIQSKQAISADLLPEGEDDDDDGSMYDKEPTKSDLKKEKIKGAPSKFEISKEDYEDFKTRLKNLVGKIKDMEKGETRDKKMAALKQFIKNPRLVKAFKERDVRIDTDGLIG
jgi:hypothetical protein